MIIPIPHQYVYVDAEAVSSKPQAPLPAVWLAVHSVPGRMFGATILLESGALYRDVPLHRLATRPDAPGWRPDEAQHWNAYGPDVQVIRLPYLDGLRLTAKCGRVRTREYAGAYVCSLQPLGDDYSRAPEQDKTFTLIALDHGRYTCQPTDRVLVHDASFTRVEGWPTDLIRNRATWSCEHTPVRETPPAPPAESDFFSALNRRSDT